MKLKIKDILILGGGIFAMFFGAGNLIFPPYLGAELGNQWFLGAVGFCIAASVLSFFGMLAYTRAGGTFEDFSKKVSPKFGRLLGTTLMLIIGPLLVVPRTCAVAYEMAIHPFFDIPLWVFSIAYFTAVFFFTISPGNIMDKLGSILTPILLCMILLLIGKSFFDTESIVALPKINNIFFESFLAGYQTLDSLGAALFTIVALNAIAEKGYTEPKARFRMMIWSGSVAIFLVILVYTGLVYLGATGANFFVDEASTSRTGLLLNIVGNSFGSVGTIFLGITVFAACFSTASGLLVAGSSFFNKELKNRLSIKKLMIVISVVSAVLSPLGVEGIVQISVPILQILYPVVIILSLVNLTDRLFPQPLAYKLAVYTSLVLGTLLVLIELPIFQHTPLESYLKLLPFVESGFGWFMPSVLALVIGSVIEKCFFSLESSKLFNVNKRK